jgi:hypothetical protein
VDFDDVTAVADARQVLLALVRALPVTPELVDIPAHVRGDRAWGAFVDQAGQHGLLPLAAPLLRSGHAPPAIQAAIDQRLAVGSMWQKHVAATLGRVLDILHDAGVDPAALKGPVLAERLYDDALARPSMDIDLLVYPSDLERSAAALREAGYAGDTDLEASYLLEHAHHLHFAQPGAPAIELHFRAYSGFGVVVPADALMDRAVQHQFYGRTRVLVPAPEDEFIYLAVHAAGHSFVRLLWLFDLKMLLRRHPQMDWAAVANRAESFGLTSAVAYAMRVLREWLHVDPGGVPRPLLRRGARSRVADRLLAEVSTPRARSVRDNIGGLVFTSLLCDRLGATGWLLQHHLGRAVRHRLQRLAPRYLPEDWAA